MESSIACATLNLASWMVPNGEANAAFCERSTTGGRAISAARSCCPTPLASSSKMKTPRPKGVPRPPSGPLRNATISRLPPPLQNANNILLPAQGGVMAQMRRIFYWRIKLAILLIGRPVATMLPQAAHRRATLAARSAQPPLNVIKTRDGRSRSCPARRAVRERKRDRQPDRQREFGQPQLPLLQPRREQHPCVKAASP